MTMRPDSQPELWDLIREDWTSHGRDWTRPGFRALAIYRFGVWRRGQPAAIRALVGFPYRALHRFARNLYGIELPDTARIGRRVVIEHQSGIVIHGGAVIGDECTLRQNVTIGNRRRRSPLDAPTLGNRVDVGAGAKILGCVDIGDDAIIGANAVVLDHVPAGATAVGIPARIVGKESSLRADASHDGIA